MAEAVDLIRKARQKGWTDAELASMMKVTTKSIENWGKGVFNPHKEKLQKLKELADVEPGRSEVREDTMETLLLRVQNILLNLEAREKTNAEFIKTIYRLQTKKSKMDVNSVYKRVLSGFLTGSLSDQQLIDIESL